MVGLVHKIPDAQQQDGVTHVKLDRLEETGGQIHPFWRYGEMVDGSFVPKFWCDPAESRPAVRIRITDVAAFDDFAGSGDTVPDVAKTNKDRYHQDIANYLDDQQKWF